MHIFDKEPKDWRDLQELVGQLFEELGCAVTIGAKVQLVRGQKEIDVLAVDSGVTPQSTYAIECKHWSSPIPQEVVHSFRTVVADFGAHRGLIISKVGFQSGAYEATKNTNIDLYSFQQLQATFFDRWRAAMAKRHMASADALFPYWDPVGGRMPPSHWGDDERQKLHLLVEAYQPFITLGPTLSYSGYVLALPMKVLVLSEDLVKEGELDIQTYRQFYDFIDSNSEIALQRFKRLFAERE
jgi:hypothetical protein